MSNLTIKDFWKRRLPVTPVQGASLVRGWSYETQGLKTFKEAPLSIDSELGENGDEEKYSILLVSAPGAVGKSTLAREIAHATGAVYIDLAKTDPVGGNTLSGGLAKSGLFQSWKEQTTAVLIDSLDEARFRVTQEAFEAFLSDIAELSTQRKVPTVLFGRTGAVQDSWLLLDGHSAKTAVIEIGYYDPISSIEFAAAQLRAMRPSSQHTNVEHQAIALLLQKLRTQTDSDGDRFSGYAPVLRAVAERVADSNPAALIAEIEKGEKPVTLQTVVEAILERERKKLDTLQFENPELNGVLYSPQEQLDRLVAHLYKVPTPALASMSANDTKIYSRALEAWVPEHPFLDGAFGTSSVVFDATISTHALRTQHAAEAAVQRELNRGAAANPFLSEFYVPNESSAEQLYLPPEHIGILYSSLRARLSLGDSASLSVEPPEGAENEDGLKAEVEITLARRDADQARTLKFDSEQTGTLRLGAYIEDVEIDAPYSRVEIGPGPEAVLIAPISIQCAELSLTTDKVIAEVAMGRSEAAIYLEANDYIGPQITSVPIIRGDVRLTVSWPDARNHPWTNFASAPHPIDDPRLDEALRRFRKFVIAFRSHSKGNLARYKHKLEHSRMTKGMGEAVLKLLISDQIISLKGPMYFLDPDLLGKLANTSYAECMSRRFGAPTIQYISKALTLDSQ